MPDGSPIQHDKVEGWAIYAWPNTIDRSTYVRTAAAWVAFTAPEKIGWREVDPIALADHFVLVGFDDAYYAGLMRLFRLLHMGD